MSSENITALEESRQAIFNLDLERVLKKITQQDNSLTGIEKPWSVSRAREAEKQYKRYLWVVRKYKNDHPFLPPSREIDFIWHAHILDTKKYHQDSRRIFGEYLHHDPYFGLNGEADERHLHESFDLTQQLYFNEFGEYIYEIEEECDKNET